MQECGVVKAEIILCWCCLIYIILMGCFFFTLIKNPISISSNTDVLVISKFLTCASGNSHAEWEVDA